MVPARHAGRRQLGLTYYQKGGINAYVLFTGEEALDPGRWLRLDSLPASVYQSGGSGAPRGPGAARPHILPGKQGMSAYVLVTGEEDHGPGRWCRYESKWRLKGEPEPPVWYRARLLGYLRAFLHELVDS